MTTLMSCANGLHGLLVALQSLFVSLTSQVHSSPPGITHTPDELEYHVSNSDSVMVLGSGKHLTSAAAVAHKLHLPFHSVEVTALGSLPLPQTAFPVHLDREAMMIYTRSALSGILP